MDHARRSLLAAGLVGSIALLTACNAVPPDLDAAIEEYPAVRDSDVTIGPGGGLTSRINGLITLDSTSDSLRADFEEAWGRGIEYLHRTTDGDPSMEVGAVTGQAGDQQITARDLLGLDLGVILTSGHFYDHYGLS